MAAERQGSWIVAIRGNAVLKNVTVKHERWTELDDESLERLLVERWVLRGLVLAVMFAAAVALTYVGLQGVATFTDRLTLGVLLVTALGAGIVAFLMRSNDLRLHRELRRRRHAP